MSKFSTIVPICFTIISGCTLCNCDELKSDKPILSTPVTQNETMPAARSPENPSVLVEKVKEPKTVRRAFNREEILRLQTRMREIGLNPGPVDGIAGTETKSLLDRLNTGCTELEPLIQVLPESSQQLNEKSATRSAPGRAETIKLQTGLRSVGFDPGPADGIFGRKTKAAVVQLQAGCALAVEYNELLDDHTQAVMGEPASTIAGQRPETSHQAEPARQAPSRQVPSREEVRILQLRLRDAGFDPGPFDGIMGRKTKIALEQYEAREGVGKIKISAQEKIVSGRY